MSKTILITGSTDGIGKLTALKLAKLGHQVFLHGRNEKKLLDTIDEIKQASNNNDIDGFVADFSNLEAVSKMASEVNRKLSKLDVLINNAGIFKTATTNSDGTDIRLKVNYLAPYILTQNILPLLEQNENARIINLSSAAQASVSLEALTGQISISNSNEAYAQSKLALTMWSFELAEKLNNTVVIAVNPGSLLNTKMANEAYGQHWSSADKGRDILYDLAMSENFKKDTGKYFDNDKGSFSQAHPDAYNNKRIEELIATTKQIIN